METNLSQTIDLALQKARYDAIIKEIIADKQVLARILKYTLDEFKDFTIDTIMKSMETPQISNVRVEPGHTNTEKIEKYADEDSVPGEGKIYYDIRFNVYCGEELTKILINIEAQKSSNTSKLGYHIDNRVIYYLGRMISAQKEVEFSKSNYDDLKAVKSIWICMDAGDDEDSIDRLSFKQETIFGKSMSLPNIHKVQGIIIRLRENESAVKSKNDLIAMLEELLKKESSEVKKKILEEEYGMVMDDNTERRIQTMCNLSEVVLEKGYRQGLEQGIEQGIEQGMEQGIEQGIEFAIFSSVYENDFSAKRGAEKLNISLEEFNNKFNCWKLKNNKI